MSAASSPIQITMLCCCTQAGQTLDHQQCLDIHAKVTVLHGCKLLCITGSLPWGSGSKICGSTGHTCI